MVRFLIFNDEKIIKKVILVLSTFLIISTTIFLYLYLPKVEIQKIPPEGENMTKIGLIADTHVPNRAPKVQKEVFQVFRKADVDCIIHAGDITIQNVIQKLRDIAPVVAVHGNHDEGVLRDLHPAVNSLERNGWNIGVWHNPHIVTRKDKALDLAQRRNFDVLVVGHVHKQEHIREEGVFVVNPGSPTVPLPPLLVKPTVAILKLGNEANVEFVDVSTGVLGGPAIWEELTLFLGISIVVVSLLMYYLKTKVFHASS